MAARNWTENDIFKEVFENFKLEYHNWSKIVDLLSLCLIFSGVLGSFLALVTLIPSRTMRTPSFSYHKVLIASDLIFCLNWLLLKVVKTWCEIPVYTYSYNSYFVALYAGIICRTISSTCGYMTLYMSLLISVDRFLALWTPVKYKMFSQRILSNILISVSLLLSFIFHSWATLVETEILTKTLGNTTVYTYVPRSSLPSGIIRVKNIYNATVRIPYPFILSFLTFSCIWQFKKSSRRRRKMSTSSTISRRNHRHKRRCERSLFLLMISAVVLTFIQVVPREIKRILELAYPSSTMKRMTLDRSLPLEHRLQAFRTVLYGGAMFNLGTNFSVVINRSLLFYLYFLLNPSFRSAVLNRLKSCVGIARAEAHVSAASITSQSPNRYCVDGNQRERLDAIPNNCDVGERDSLVLLRDRDYIAQKGNNRCSLNLLMSPGANANGVVQNQRLSIKSDQGVFEQRIALNKENLLELINQRKSRSLCNARLGKL